MSEYKPFETCTKKYITVRYDRDCGEDEGMNFNNKADVLKYSKREIKEGWQTVACINTRKKRIEFVLGEPYNVPGMFGKAAEEVLRQNTTVIPWYYMM